MLLEKFCVVYVESSRWKTDSYRCALCSEAFLGGALNINVVNDSSHLRGEMSVVIFTATFKITFMMYFETT